MPNLSLQDQSTEFLLYTAPNGGVKVGVPAISKHLKNIFESNELQQGSVISILETTAEDAKKYQTQYYNLKGSQDD